MGDATLHLIEDNVTVRTLKKYMRSHLLEEYVLRVLGKMSPKMEFLRGRLSMDVYGRIRKHSP